MAATIDEVLDTRDDGGDHHQDHEDVVERGIARVEDQREDGHNLQDHLDLAGARCRDDFVLCGDQTQARDGEFARHDNHRDPCPHAIHRDESDQGAADQQLVGERVDEGAEDRDVAARPRNAAVDQVRETREHEQRSGDPLVPREVPEQRDDHERHQHHAKQREGIGRLHVCSLQRWLRDTRRRPIPFPHGA